MAGSWGICPTKLLFAIDCPVCGSLRAVNDLTHGELAAAASSNLLLVLALPLVVLLWGRRTAVLWRGAAEPLPVPRAVWVVGLTIAAAFMVARNTAWGSWLHS
ncbi:MAG: DUF2752 domain-containing protein [Nocardioides sp.]